MEELNKFCEEILNQKNLKVNAEEKQALVEDMSGKLNDRINKALISALNDEEAISFDKLMETNPTVEQLSDFIEKSSVDVQKVTIATMLMFKEFYLG